MEKGRLIGQGRTAEIYALADNKVLKLFRADMTHKSVEKEYALGRIIAAAGVSAPAVYEMVCHEGRQGIIYQYVSGKTMLDYLAGKPLAAMAQARSLANIHREIHQHAATGLPCQKQALAASITRVKVLAEQERQQLLNYLDTLPEGSMLCHGDFHPDNIIVSSHGTYVLDWMNAAAGNPAGDVARTTLLLRDAAPPPGIRSWKAGLLSIVRKRFYSAYIREYRQSSGLTPDQIEAWIPPVAAARIEEDLPQTEKQALLSIVRRFLEKQ